MSISQDLRRMGIGEGDVVMVHASMRAVGGRAEDVVGGICDAVGPAGTVLAYVDFESTAELLYFDAARSPAARDHGVLAEVLRRTPGVVRSTNPGASMVALGARAKWLCREHPLNYGYGPGSPLAKLVQLDGKVLLLGSDFDHVTLLHYAEHAARLPHKRVVRYVTRAFATDFEVEEFDTSRPVVASMPEDYFATVTRAFVAAGGARSGLVGKAPSCVLPAKALVDFAIAKMEQEFCQ